MNCPECNEPIDIDEVRVGSPSFPCPKCGKALCVAISYKRGINLTSVVLGLAAAIGAGRFSLFYALLLWPVVTLIVGSLLVTFGRYYITPPIEKYCPNPGSLGLHD